MKKKKQNIPGWVTCAIMSAAALFLLYTSIFTKEPVTSCQLKYAGYCPVPPTTHCDPIFAAKILNLG